MGDIVRVLLLMLSMVALVEGRRTPGRHLQHFEDGTQYVNGMVIDYKTRRPFSYLRNEVECVEFNVTALDNVSGEELPLLSYAQTEEQMTAFMDTGAISFIPGSLCNETSCSKRFLVPPNSSGKRPFYVVLVNGRNVVPVFEPKSQNALKATVVVDGCGGHSVSRAGAKIDLLPILLPIVGVIAIVVICAAFTYKYRQKYASGKDDDLTMGSDRRVPLTGVGPRRAMDGGSPPVRIVEDPVSQADYVPPVRENVDQEEPPAGPSHVYNNSMWGRWLSKKGSVKLRSIESAVGRKSEPEDIEPVEEPLPEVSENEYAASDDQGDVHDGARVGPDDEPPKPQSTKVFVNNLFTRMQSGVQRSFKTFTSFGDRERSSGVKLKSINSFAKWMKKKEVGGSAIREDEEEAHSPTSVVLPETPTREEPEDEDNSHVPGADHLSDWSDEEEASPFESPTVQKSTSERIIDL